MALAAVDRASAGLPPSASLGAGGSLRGDLDDGLMGSAGGETGDDGEGFVSGSRRVSRGSQPPSEAGPNQAAAGAPDQAGPRRSGAPRLRTRLFAARCVFSMQTPLHAQSAYFPELPADTAWTVEVKGVHAFGQQIIDTGNPCFVLMFVTFSMTRRPSADLARGHVWSISHRCILDIPACVGDDARHFDAVAAAAATSGNGAPATPDQDWLVQRLQSLIDAGFKMATGQVGISGGSHLASILHNTHDPDLAPGGRNCAVWCA